MILNEIFEPLLAERVHDIVYHATSLHNALRILKSGEYQLSSTMGSEYETSLQPPGYPYFFSTTRSKAGGYHAGGGYFSSGKVVLKLDGSWFNRNYRSGAVDYWGETPKGRSEQEDRVFSRTPTIPARNILEAHIYMSVTPNDWDGPLLRKFLIQSKKKGLLVWVYNQAADWVAQNKKNALGLDQILQIAQGELQQGRQWTSRNYIAPWMELWHKERTSDLSDRARNTKNNLLRSTTGFWLNDSLQNLSTDLANSRKPDSSNYKNANRLIAILTQQGLNLKQFVEKVKFKWDVIAISERHSVSTNQVKQAIEIGAQAELDNARGNAELARAYAINNLSYDIGHYSKSQNLNEDQAPGDVLANFLKFVCAELGLKQLPRIEFIADLKHSDTEHPTFGYFDTETDQIKIGVSGRHPLDIMRTLAHELVHYRQRLSRQLDSASGDTGSAAENQANSQAGVLMRKFADQNPDYFALPERQMNEIRLIPDFAGDEISRSTRERYDLLIKRYTRDEFEIDDITVYKTQSPDEPEIFRLLGKKNDSGNDKVVLCVVFWETEIRGVPALTVTSTWVSRQVRGRNLAARIYVAASRRYNRLIVSDDMQTSSGSRIWTQGLPKLGIKPQAYEMGFGLVSGIDPYNSPEDDVRWIFDANREITRNTFTAKGRGNPQKDDDEEDFWS